MPEKKKRRELPTHVARFAKDIRDGLRNTPGFKAKRYGLAYVRDMEHRHFKRPVDARQPGPLTPPPSTTASA